MVTLLSRWAFAGDWLYLGYMVLFGLYTWGLIRKAPALRKKYRTSLIISLVTPLVIGPVFKYLLLVPMPKEGLATALLDAIYYSIF